MILGNVGRKEGKKCGEEEMFAEAERKKTFKTAEGSANLVKMAEKPHKLVKCPSGELARVLFPKPESGREYFEETNVDVCPVYQVHQTW